MGDFVASGLVEFDQLVDAVEVDLVGGGRGGSGGEVLIFEVIIPDGVDGRGVLLPAVEHLRGINRLGE